MFFEIGALKKYRNVHNKIPVLELLFNENADTKACNYFKNRLQHRCFSVKFAASFRASFLQKIYSGCLSTYLLNSLFIAYENDKWCHCVVRIGSPPLISFYCVCFFSFYFLLSFYFLWMLLLAKVLR